MEKNIEIRFIEKLEQEQKYTYRSDIHDRDALEKNFRQKFEALNRVHLSDKEFDRLLDEIIDSDVFVASKRLREHSLFFREDGTPLQYTLVNIKDWCKNEFEVIHQLRINTRNSHHRYDVILLVNGLPLVQIELKDYEVSPRRAMQQIVDYKNDSGNGYSNTLLCFMQLFIVSNQTNTYFFANNNNRHFNFNADEHYLPVYKWADENNQKILNLDAFREAFLPKCKLGEMISRYMILIACEQKLLVMRPYQIYAVKAIIKSIEENRGNGYIWHTTGSGKTLTSFKASTILKDNPDIEKCLFVVDRKDLDRQTREEFNRFQEKCVEENTNTDSLVRRMLSNDYADKVIVTTIQKLAVALDPQNRRKYFDRLKPLRDKKMVFIFDECHRSQFGDNHKAIKEFFPKAQLFGFTGTPIFEKNAIYTQITGEEAQYKTTKDIFPNELHTYTITNAIEDENVLRFHIDYFQTDQVNVDISERQRKQAIVDSILQKQDDDGTIKHDIATNHRRFNALFATDSIDDAIEYYKLFKATQKKRIAEDSTFEPLNIACIFSPPAEGNKDTEQLQEDLPREQYDNKKEPDKKKTALQAIIKDYNRQYGTSHTINEFDAYYQDVQKRIKDQQYSNKDYPRVHKIDIAIVVDMLLTGFDSKYLNTLYVDKRLQYHGLIQAFSRTNRILNDTKPYGNILDFRGQQNAVDEAIALFSGKQPEQARQIWLVEPAEKVIEKYRGAIDNLRDFMRGQDVDFSAEGVNNLQGDAARIEFVNLFKEVQRCKTKIDQYTDIPAEEHTIIDNLLTPAELQAFRSAYLETARDMRSKREQNPESVSIEIQDLDFEFVLFASSIIDYDYIMELITRYVGEPKKLKMTKEQLIGLISSSANLIDERDDIIAYLDSLDGVNGRTVEEVKAGYELFKTEKYAKELMAVSERNHIAITSLQHFVNDIIERSIFDGEKLYDLLEPLNLGWRARTEAEKTLMNDLVPLLKRMTGGKEISGLSAYEKDI